MGIGVVEPSVELTVAGSISARDTVYADAHASFHFSGGTPTAHNAFTHAKNWNYTSTHTTVKENSASWLTSLSAFSKIAVAGQTTVQADSGSEFGDILTLSAAGTINIITDAATDTITISSGPHTTSGGGGGGNQVSAAGSDMDVWNNGTTTYISGGPTDAPTTPTTITGANSATTIALTQTPGYSVWNVSSSQLSITVTTGTNACGHRIFITTSAATCLTFAGEAIYWTSGSVPNAIPNNKNAALTFTTLGGKIWGSWNYGG